MPDRRVSDDVRLQRLADLSIEIRMLKSRVQTALEDEAQVESAFVHDSKLLIFRTPQSAARCPHCGHTAGLALLPREYRRLSTLVRCFSCQRDSAAFDWVAATPQTSIDESHQAGTRAGN